MGFNIFNKLQHTSVRDLLVMNNRRNRFADEVVSGKKTATTEGEDREKVYSLINDKAKGIPKTLEYIPVFGQGISSVKEGSSSLASAFNVFNTSIREQDQASKSKRGASLKHYQNIGKSTLHLGKTGGQLYVDLAPITDYGFKNDSTIHRYDEDLVL